MAKGLKYYFEFLGKTSGTFKCEFWFEGFTGDATILKASSRPFVLSEYNTSEDIFKPIRPFQATIEIIGSSTGISMDDFVMDNDNDIEVRFFYNSSTTYWKGYIIQDNFQEIWQDTEHIIVLTATEGIGQLENVQFSNNGNEVIGRIKPLQAIEYSLQQTVLPLVPYTAFNNLFHDSMNSGSTKFPLDQCYIDTRSFQIEARDFDNKLQVINKVNSAFSQTMFQYKGEWFIHRIEEWYTPTTNNLRGFRDSGTRSALNKRYDVNVGVDEYIKPISPDMLRYIKRRTKKDQVQYNYTPFNEVIENESFTRGEILSTNPSVILKVLDSWETQKGTILYPTILGTNAFIREEYFNDVLQQNYALFNISEKNEPYFIKSAKSEVLSYQVLDIQFDIQYDIYDFGNEKIPVCYVLLYGTTSNYSLDENGKWNPFVVSPSTNVKSIQVKFDSNVKGDEWNTINIISDNLPQSGDIYVYFNGVIPSSSAYNTNEFRIKNFVFKVIPAFQVDTERRNITGQLGYFEKTDYLRNNDEFEIFFDDGFSKSHKGTIYESDEETMTNRRWFRYRFDEEIMPFKKEALIAKWQFNRFNRNKIDVTFYNIFDDTTPIGLMNTIRFVDDDPNKVYAILNMKEIDFNANTWTATLLEVFDDDKDISEPVTNYFEAEVTDGTYNSISYIPFTIITPADITISSSNIFTYNANDTITVDISCTVGGYINNASSVPSTVDLSFQLNGSTIQTATIYVNSLPEPFNVDLSVTDIELNYLDSFDVYIDSNIYEIQLNSGTISFSYTNPVPFVYDPYTEKYISN